MQIATVRINGCIKHLNMKFQSFGNSYKMEVYKVTLAALVEISTRII